MNTYLVDALLSNKKKKTSGFSLSASLQECIYKESFGHILPDLIAVFPKEVLFMQSSLLHCQKQRFSLEFYKNRTECF